MGHDAIKLELIEWLIQFEDDEMINYLKVVKESDNGRDDWWDDLTDEQKNGNKKRAKRYR